MQQRLHEVRQQPETLGDDGLIRRERQQILNDQAEALAAEPVKGFSIVSGERLTHLSSMLIFSHSVRGQSSGRHRCAWSLIASPVE
jgi:hypothetical protein